MESNKKLRIKKAASVSYTSAAAVVARRPTVCAFDLPAGLTVDEQARLRPLCGMGCEDGCPYAC